MTTKRVSDNNLAMSTGTGAAPARRKSNTSKRVSRPAVAVEVPSTPAVVSVAPVSESSSEKVARLAYTYWAGRGYQGGSPEEDWLRAEQALRATTASK